MPKRTGKFQGTCEWFLRCRNRAKGAQDHPTLGKVPICTRCRRWYESLRGS